VDFAIRHVDEALKKDGMLEMAMLAKAFFMAFF
jgi:hypothetical protein